MPQRSTVVVSAAVLCRADGALFLTRRRPHEAFAGDWEFPGGKVEWGEHPEATLRRELREELGIEVVHAVLYDLVAYVREDTHWIVLFYLVPVPAFPLTSSDERSGRWVRTDELPGLGIMAPDEPVARRLVREGRDPKSLFRRVLQEFFAESAAMSKPQPGDQGGQA